MDSLRRCVLDDDWAWTRELAREDARPLRRSIRERRGDGHARSGISEGAAAMVDQPSPSSSPRLALPSVAPMRRTKIVATIGPASRDPEILAPHGRGGHGRRAPELLPRQRSRSTPRRRSWSATPPSRAGRPVAILQDLPGPKLRIGQLDDGHRRARARRPRDVHLRRDDGPATRERMTVTLARARRRGRAGRDRLPRRRLGAPARHAVRAGDGEFDCEVEIGGVVASRQGLNIPGEAESCPSVPEEDLELLRAGERDRRRHRRAVLRAPARGRRRACASTRACR